MHSLSSGSNYPVHTIVHIYLYNLCRFSQFHFLFGLELNQIPAKTGNGMKINSRTNCNEKIKYTNCNDGLRFEIYAITNDVIKYAITK